MNDRFMTHGRAMGVRVPMTEWLMIDERYQGLPGTGHPGYVAGLLARQLRGSVRVRFKRPIPVEELLQVRPTGKKGALLVRGTQVFAEAARTDLDLEVPEAPSVEAAEAARGRSEALLEPHWEDCFCCGAHREPGNGLRIFPGPVDGTELVAATWEPAQAMADPTGHVRPEYVWTALDCPGTWAVVNAKLPSGAAGIATAELEARIVGVVRPDRRYVLTAWARNGRGPRVHAGVSLHGHDGRLVAYGRKAMLVTQPAKADGPPNGLTLSAPV